MRKTWTLAALGAALAAVFAGGGCYNFDEAERRCIEEGRCESDGPGPTDGGSDGGDAGGGDGGGQDDGGQDGGDAGCDPTSLDLPDDAFADTDCDGVDGRADAGFFIDPVSGNDTTGTGARTAPLRTLGRALQLLREADGGGPARLYLAGGNYNEAGLVLDVPASLHGGYVRRDGGWGRNGTALARVDGGTVGMTVRGLPDAGIVLEYLSIRSSGGTAPGEPSIALRVLSSSGIELRRAVLEAGLGAPGADGGAGNRGEDGLDGGNGGNATGTTVGGAGTAVSWSCSGSNRSGGDGVIGVARNGGNTGARGNPDAGRGGDGGTATSSLDCTPVVPPNICTCDGGPGNPGVAGFTGAEGPSGNKGTGRGTLDLAGETWRPDPPGGQGEPGFAGGGGGGGGSGGACAEGVVTFPPGASGGGGAGGGGGCGGTGGQGGGGGGASIALLLIDAQVSVSAGTELRTRGGGPGGSGGPGGEGGRGGEGGGGGTGGLVSNSALGTRYDTQGGTGGNGGRGGDGGSGGPGGGGGGGPSVGVWCGAGAGLALVEGEVVFNLGNPGPGGASTGNRGDDGLRENVLDCQPIP